MICKHCGQNTTQAIIGELEDLNLMTSYEPKSLTEGGGILERCPRCLGAIEDKGHAMCRRCARTWPTPWWRIRYLTERRFPPYDQQEIGPEFIGWHGEM